MFVVIIAIFVLGAQSQSSDIVCVEGFVMDLYCINRGTLLDAPNTKTLEEPNQHSVHCLVDVERCRVSGYEILVPTISGSPKYGRALSLDDTGNRKVIELARKVGMRGRCTSCNEDGKLEKGFRVTVTGVISKGSSGPNKFVVSTMIASPRLFNISAADGCTAETRATITLFTEAGRYQKASIAHGSLMIISWGLLLPTGVMSARWLKHRPNALWFKLHRIIQTVGLIIATTGWIIALATFDVFTARDSSYVHGALGMTVMVLGILQPINAFIRPHPGGDGEATPLKRRIWEITHKFSGRIAIVLAAATILLGTTRIFSHNTAFQITWGVTLAWALVFALASAWDRKRPADFQMTSQVEDTEMNK